MKIISLQHNHQRISPIEKIISILSYMTMGIVGVVWFLIAYFTKKRLKFFLQYNVIQSVIISLVLSIIKYLLTLIIPILWIIPVLNHIGNALNFIFLVKIIRIYSLNISFTIFELLLFIFLTYIIIGVVIGRIFYIPILSRLMEKVIKRNN